MNTPKTSPLPSSPLSVSVDVTNPAPWTVERSVGHQPNAEQAGVGHVVAVARCYHQEDAELFASAPALLSRIEALEGALRQIDGIAAGGHTPSHLHIHMLAIKALNPQQEGKSQPSKFGTMDGACER